MPTYNELILQVESISGLFTIAMSGASVRFRVLGLGTFLLFGVAGLIELIRLFVCCVVHALRLLGARVVF